MKYWVDSVLTWAFWRHIFFSSWKPYLRFLEWVGGLFIAAQIIDFFDLYPDLIRQPYVLAAMLIVAAVAGIAARFPVRKVTYRVPGKDYFIDVQIGNILDAPNGIVVSTNSSFETNPKIIAPDSLQGQFVARYFQGDTAELDRLIKEGLSHQAAGGPGEKRKYALGTVAKIPADGKFFYLLAMADLNEHGNAQLDERALDEVLEGLWRGLREQGELGQFYVPVIGSGRGRIQMPRQKLIERIAQSFVYSSRDRKIANRLTIMVTDEDARTYDLNLFQVRDYLTMSLHI